MTGAKNHPYSVSATFFSSLLHSPNHLDGSPFPLLCLHTLHHHPELQQPTRVRVWKNRGTSTSPVTRIFRRFSKTRQHLDDAAAAQAPAASTATADGPTSWCKWAASRTAIHASHAPDGGPRNEPRWRHVRPTTRTDGWTDGRTNGPTHGYAPRHATKANAYGWPWTDAHGWPATNGRTPWRTDGRTHVHGSSTTGRYGWTDANGGSDANGTTRPTTKHEHEHEHGAKTKFAIQ